MKLIIVLSALLIGCASVPGFSTEGHVHPCSHDHENGDAFHVHTAALDCSDAVVETLLNGLGEGAPEVVE